MRKFCVVITIICFAGMSTGCGHVIFPKSPVEPTQKPIDEKMNCEDYQKEIVLMREKYDSEIGPGAQAGLNIFNFAAGFFTLFNWFLIDFSTGRGEVCKSFQDREAYLVKLCDEKGCQQPPADVRKVAKLTAPTVAKTSGGNVVSTPPAKSPDSDRPSLFGNNPGLNPDRRGN